MPVEVSLSISRKSIPSQPPSRCHVYPNSFVIVREHEPTSIIAFTLSSKDYIRYIRQPPNADADTPRPPPPVPQWIKAGGDCEVKMKIFSHEGSSPGDGMHVKYSKYPAIKHAITTIPRQTRLHLQNSATPKTPLHAPSTTPPNSSPSVASVG